MSEQTWPLPGVRLTETTMPATQGEVNLPSAVPVFVGWRNDKPMNSTMSVTYLAAWDQVSEQARNQTSCLWMTVRHYFDNGGGPCFVLEGPPTPPHYSQSDLTQWWSTFLDKACGWLLAEPGITLVAVPQLVGLVEPVKLAKGVDVNAVAETRPPQGTITAPEAALHHHQTGTLIALWQALVQACSSRPDLFFVLDAPRDPAMATACLQQLRQSSGLADGAQRVALYGPHLETDYPDGETAFRVLPPCGAVLGAYGRSDASAGPWKAPANERLWHVVKPEYRETLLTAWFNIEHAPINLIRSFSGRGTRIWGCRTLASGTPFRYVQVRRVVTWIEANLRQICRFAVFEPNNEIVWFQLRGLCSAWLRRVWLEGGLAGADEASAYSVQVGLNDSMTAADVAAGRLIIRVGVAALHAAEFIEIKLELTVGDDQNRVGSGST